MNNGRHKKARSERIQERKRVKKNESNKKNAHVKKERMNHRMNVVAAKKQELVNLWMETVAKQFESQQQTK